MVLNRILKALTYQLNCGYLHNLSSHIQKVIIRYLIERRNSFKSSQAIQLCPCKNCRLSNILFIFQMFLFIFFFLHVCAYACVNIFFDYFLDMYHQHTHVLVVNFYMINIKGYFMNCIENLSIDLTQFTLIYLKLHL